MVTPTWKRRETKTMSESAGSDSEFERYMQDSFSSSIASSLSLSRSNNQLSNNNASTNDHRHSADTGGLSTLGMSWLKSPGHHVKSATPSRHSIDVNLPLTAAEREELLPQWLQEEEEGGGGVRLSTSGRKLSHRSSITEDPLNFSQSSGYSILSELEHQLGMRTPSSKLPSPSRHPGEETLAEEDDKKRFFEELEKGKDSPLDYSELNRQLSNTSVSLRGLTPANPLKTIDERDDLSHVSNDDKEAGSHNKSHAHLPDVAMGDHQGQISRTGTLSDSSLQSSSNHSLSLPSPLHSSSAQSISKVKTPTKVQTVSTNKEKLLPINEGRSNDGSAPVITGSQLTSSVRVSSSTDQLKPLPHKDTSVQSLVPTSSIIATVPEVAVDPNTRKPHSLATPLSPPQLTASPMMAGGKPVTKATGEFPGTGSNGGEKNLGELLRALAGEELATLTHEILARETENGGGEGKREGAQGKDGMTVNYEGETSSDDSTIEEGSNMYRDSLESSGSLRSCSLTTPTAATPSFKSTVNVPDNSRHGDNSGRRDNLLTLNDSLGIVRVELNNEKQCVLQLEERLREKERQEERVKLEYSQQIRELRTQLLDTKSKLRKLEDKSKHAQSSVLSPDKEQERLIHGYQKENEKLYAEMEQLKKDFRTAKEDLTNDNSRLGIDLANMRVKCSSQEETLRQLRGQLERHKSYGDPLTSGDHDNNMMDVKLLEEKCESLQGQIEVLNLASQEHRNELKEKNKDILKLQAEKDELQANHTVQVVSMRNEISILREKITLENGSSHHQLKDSLGDIIKAPPTHPRFPVTSKAGSSGKTINRPLSLPSNKGGGPQLVRSRTAADARKIKDLERQVQELYNALKKRHPNSIPVLMHASAKTVEDERETVEYMERRVREQEGQVREREEEGKRRLDQLQEQFHEMEALYEEQIASLTSQLMVAKRTVSSDKENTVTNNDTNTELTSSNKQLNTENVRLKEKISQLSFELAHQKVQLKGCLAEVDSERRQTREQWMEKMKRLEETHKQKLDQLMVSLVKDREASNVARLQARLDAREAKIRLLEEEVDLVRTDGEILSVLKVREEELEKQVDTLKEELLEAKKHHTPEMYHYSSLLAKISQLETRQVEYQRTISEATATHVTQDDLNKLECRYKKKLMEKNKQIESFREELEALMDTLYAIKKGNVIVQQQT